MKKVIAIIQARMTSTRLPGKVLKEINGKPTLWYLIENIKYSKRITDIIIATTSNVSDDGVEAFCKENNLICFRGSENNVLERYYLAANEIDALDSDIIVRITADDIFNDPYIIDSLTIMFESTYPYYKYFSNSFKPGFPYGLYFELFDFASLKEAYTSAVTDFQKEHVTPYIRDNNKQFPAISIESLGVDFSDTHLSIDTIDDFNKNCRLIEILDSQNKKQPYLFNDVVSAYKQV